MLYTLVNQNRSFTTGIFRTPDAAESWALTHVPEVQLEAVELLVSKDIEDFLTEAEVTSALVKFTPKVSRC